MWPQPAAQCHFGGFTGDDFESMSFGILSKAILSKRFVWKGLSWFTNSTINLPMSLWAEKVCLERLVHQ